MLLVLLFFIPYAFIIFYTSKRGREVLVVVFYYLLTASGISGSLVTISDSAMLCYFSRSTLSQSRECDLIDGALGAAS